MAKKQKQKLPELKRPAVNQQKPRPVQFQNANTGVFGHSIHTFQSGGKDVVDIRGGRSNLEETASRIFVSLLEKIDGDIKTVEEVIPEMDLAINATYEFYDRINAVNAQRAEAAQEKAKVAKEEEEKKKAKALEDARERVAEADKKNADALAEKQQPAEAVESAADTKSEQQPAEVAAGD